MSRSRRKGGSDSSAGDEPALPGDVTPSKRAGRSAEGGQDSAKPLVLEELEARILLSTWTLQDPDAGAAVAEQELSADEVASLSPSSGDSTPATFDAADALDGTSEQPADEVRRELVFIDESVEDYDQLLNDLHANSDESREFEVLLLSNARDGIEQITDILSDYQGVDAIHIISHGTEGAAQLGDGWLSGDTLSGYETQLASWSEALSEDADLLFYGCDLAGGESGEALVGSIAKLTGADVAASNDPTGAAILGGDWDLETRVGELESEVAFSESLQAKWNSTLDITSNLETHLTFDAGEGAQDSSGNARDGILSDDAAVDTTLATNQIGDGKLTLDGSDDYVDLSAHASALAGFAEGTISAWINTSAASQQMIFNLGDTGGSDFASLQLLGSGQIRWWVSESGSTTVDVSTNDTFNDGSWHHVAVTVGSSGTSLWVDGAELTGGDVTFFNGSSTSTNFFDDLSGVARAEVGAYELSGTMYDEFNGLIDDFRLYDRALTAGDIAELQSPNSAPVGTGTAIWAENGSTTPETSEWDGTSFGAEGTTATVGTWRTMQAAEAPTRDEKIAVGVSEGGKVAAMVWDGTSWSARPGGSLGSVSETYWYGAEVAYESLSGDALLVWNDDNQTAGNKLRFSVWDGTSWTTAASIPAYSGSEPQNMKLVSSPTSDEMVLVVSDSSADDHVLVWNGSSWGNALMLDASGTGENDQSGFAVAYESQSGDAMVVYGKDNDPDAYYRIWNGSSWGTEQTIDAPGGVSDQARWTSIASDPTSDRIVLGTMTSGSDVWLTTWDGSAWAVGTVVETSTTGLTYPNMDVAFESQSGEAIAVYGESGQSVVRYRTWSEGSGWSAEQTGPSLGATPNSMTLDSDPASNGIMLSVQDSDADLNMALWDGSSFGAVTEHETDTGETKNQPFVFLWDQNANQAPVLAGANDLDTIAEDPVTNSGTLVSDLLTGQIADADDPAGIAVVAVDDTNGAWEYTTDGGGTWLAFGSPSASAARLLTGDASTYVRFVPDADWTGTVTNGLTFHAWDQSSGIAGSTADLSSSETVLDQFGVASFSNDDGTQAWSGAWIESDAAGAGAGAGNIRVTGGELSLRGVGNTIAREIDLSGALSANLSFDFRTTSGVEAADPDSIVLEVSGDGGGSWTTLDTFDAFDGVNSGSRSYDISAHTSVDTQIRFRVANGYDGPDEYFLIDNVQIDYAVEVTGGSTAFSTATASSGITVDPVNDAPVLTNGITGTIFENGSGLAPFFTNGTVSDSDSADFAGGTLTFSVASGGDGSEGLSLAAFAGVTTSGSDVFVSGVQVGTYSGGAGGTPLVVTFDADATETRVESVYKALAIHVTGEDPTSGLRNLEVVLTDGDGGTSNIATASTTFSAVNDDPIAVGDSFIAVEGIPYTAQLGVDDLLINDSDVEGDTLSVNTTPVSGPANGTVVLNADGTFTYTANDNFNGTDSFVYEVLDGHGGTAQATASITVHPREIRILFTTQSDVNSSKVPGISSWDAGDVLAIGDPNLSFEPVGSDGSVLPYMDLEAFAASNDMTINGLHFVSNAVTVGGANSVDLERGDLVFVSENDETMTSTNSLSISAGDVIVFRPDSANDYSSGTFIHLLDQPGTAKTTGITLIENDVLIGDVTLQAGSFLFTQESVVEESSIFHFSADDVGAGTTTGTVSTLISSVDVDVNWNSFVGVMVISEDLYLDGTMVPAGSIVTTLSGGDSFVGDNGIEINEDEIFYFTVHTTTMGSGTTSADATVLFDGGDIGLNSSQKKMRSLAIIEEIIPVDNVDPDIVLAPAFVNYAETDPPTIIGAGATLTDPDSPDFDGGLLRVDLDTTGTVNDRLAIFHEGNAAGQVGVSGSVVSYGGVVIGTVAGGTDGSDPLTVLFNANADVEAVEAVMQNVTYENVSNNPLTSQRSAKFSVTDGDGGSSDIVAKTIVINSVNVAPVITGTNDLTAIDEDAFNNGGMLVSDLVAGWVTDTDPGALGGIAVVGVDNTNGSWQFSVDGGSTWTVFGTPSANDARLLATNPDTFVRFVPDPNWNGTVTNGVTFHAWDQTSGVNGDAVDLVASGSLRDQFDSVSFANQDGSGVWTSDWMEFNDAGGAASGNVRVENDKLRLDNLDGGTPESVSRSADLSDATSATLSFDYDAFGEGGLDIVAFEVSNDGGTTWTLLESMNIVGNISGSKSYELQGFTALSAEMEVRFRVVQGLGGTTQHINFDNVDIAYSGPGVGGSSSVSVATASSSISVNAVNDAPSMTAWFDAAWTGRKVLTIDAAQVAGDVTGFPVLVTLNADAELAAQALANGDDIVFTSGDGSTQLAHEIEYFNEATGELRVWVKADLSATVDTDLYIYYGNATATNQEDASGVWSSNYVGVYHLAESPTGAVGELVDSSGSGNHATAEGSMDASDSVATAVGEGLAFDGIDDKLRIPDSASLDGLNDAATFSLWINWEDAADGNHQIIMTSENRFSGGDGYEWASQGDGDHFFYPDATNPDGNYNLGLNPFTNDQWHHLAVTMDYSAQEVKIYVDGDEMAFNYEGVPTQWTDLSDSGDLLWGGNPERASRFFLGMMDEIRLVDAVRSQEWIQTEFNNQANPGAFVSVGASELPLSQHALTDIDEDDSNSPGDSVLSIIASVGGDRITDADVGAVEGIAVVGVDDSNGEWQYDADANGTWVAFGSVSDSQAVLLDTDARVRFVPNPDYNGSAGLLTFRAWDQTSGSNGDVSVDVSTNGNDSAFSSETAVASLNVNPQNDAPTAVNDTATVNEGASVLIDLAGNDSDPDNALDLTSLVITSGPSNGTLVNNNDGTFTYTHDGSETTGDAFSYTIDDASGATSNVASVTLTVTPQNDAPTAANDTATVNEGASVLIDLAGNDSDPENALDLTSLVITSGPSNGTLVNNNDGTFTYTHDGTETAGDAFSYTIDDASGATSNVASVTLTVTPQNDAPTAVNDTATVNEGASVLIDLAGNDSDPDNALDLTSLVIASGPSNGTLVDNNDGTFTYTHDGSETIGDAFSYTIDDASGATSTVASVTLTVTPQNDAPTAVDDTATVNEGASVLIDLAGNDSDPDNALDLTSLVITSGPSNGTLVNNNDGTFTYTHDGTETAGDAFSYTIDDASGATSNVASVTLTVTPQNDAPTAVNDTATVNEGASVLIDLAGNDSDPDNALDLTSLVITSGPSNGTLVDNNDGTFTYTHDGSETIGDVFSYTIDDASGATSNVASVTLTVTPQNDAPTAVNDTATVNEGASVLIDLAGNDSDPDDALDLMSLVITSGPSNGTLVNNNDGTFTYTHDGSETTGDVFSYTIDDASGATSNVASVTLTVTPQNDAPTAVDDTATVNEGASVLIDLAGNDSDLDNALDLTSLVITSGPSNGTLVNNNDGTFTYTHDGSETIGDAFSYTIDDASGATSNVASVTLTVTPQNDPPTAASDTATVNEGASVLIDLAGNDSDPDSALDLTSLVVTSGPSNGTLVNNNDGTFTYTHDGSETIGDAFSYTIDDASGATSNVASVTLTVTPQNDAPTAVNDTATVVEGASVLIDLSGNDSDPDNALDLTSLVITSGPSNGTLVDNNDGTFTYTHDGSETTGDAFSYTIDDASGATSNVASVTLTVTPQNDAPSAVNDTATVNEGASVLVDLAGNDSDPDNALDVTSLVITSGPSNGTLVDNNDGTFTYTHDGSETTGDAFSYTIDDASGATSNVASVTLTVTPQNDAPTAVNDTATVNEGASVLIDLSGNDLDPDNALDLTSLVVTSGPSNGTLVNNNDGTFTYTHDGSETTGDAFSYTIDDASGATSNVASVTLTVTPQNDAPTAVNDTATVNEGASVLVDLSGNDSDPDNALDLTSLVITSGPSNGTLVNNNDGTFTYTHDGSETAGDAFSYTINDASGTTSNVASVTLTVTSQNDAPTAVNDTATVNEGASVLIALAGNDSDPDSALDLTSLVITSGPSNGTLVNNNDGTFTYTHDGSETIGDAFSYTIDDASGATSNVASVTLTVTPQNDAPTAVDDTAAVNEGASVLIDLAGNDSDPDNALDLTSLVITSGPSNGTLVDNNDGTFTYTHDGSETIGDAFSYTIDDASGATSNVASVTLTVTPQNDAPTAVDDTATVNEGASVLIDLAGNDSDPDNALDLTSLVITSGPSNGTLVDNNDGTFTYTHDGSETAGDVFSYTIDDASGATSNVASVTLTVTPQNDAPTAVNDTATVNEGASVLIDLAGNDSDPDNALDLTSLVITSGPSNGTLVDNNDGTFTYTHDGSETIGDAFSYTIDDASGATSNVASVTLTVTPQNDAPTAVDDTAAVNEGASVLIDLAGNDSDPDNALDLTSLVITSGPSNGTLVDNNDGTFTYTHDGSETIGDAFSYTIDDASGATSNVASVTLTVTPQNDAPTAVDDTATVNEGASVLIDLAGNDSDPDNALDLTSLVITSGPSNGTLVDNNDGTFTYTHDGSETAGDVFSYTIDDASGATSNVASVTLTVTPQNDAPTAVNDTATVNEGASVLIDLAGNDSDPDNALDLTSLVITSGPSNGTLVDNNDGTFTYTHDGSETIGDAFSYTIDDASGATSNVASVTLTVTPQNDAPTAVNDTATVNEGASVLIDLAGNDSDPDNALDLTSLVITSGPSNGTLVDNNDGTFTYTHDGSDTTGDVFSYTIDDASGATSNVASVTLTVTPQNDAPTAVNDTATVNEGASVLIDLAGNDSDPDNALDLTSLVITSGPSNGTLVNNNDGTFTYTHDGSETIGDAFSYTIDDVSGATSNVASVTLTVTPQNDAPTAVNDTATVAEGASVLIDLAGNDSDPDNALDLTSLVITSGPSNGTLVDNNDGTFTYTHDGSETAGDVFSYTIDDASGATSNVASVTLTVTPQNDAPTAVNDTATVNEGASVLIDLAGNDSDPDNALDLTSLVITSGPSNGTLVNNNDGTFTYTHDGSETAGDVFSYTIDDASGATSNVASVILTVTPQNDAPTAMNDTATVNEGASVLIDLAVNDSDPDNALDPTSLVITSGPSNGTLVNNNDGTFTYTHDGSETVGDVFSYTIDDASGATSNVASVTLTVTPQNDAPTAVNDTATVNEGASVLIDLAGNDSDPDNALDLTSLVITSGPSNGTLVDNNDGTFTYTHDGSDTTGDAFSYTIDDASGATSNVASVTLTVTPQNDAPTAVDDMATVNEGASVLIDLAGNDSDPDNALDPTSLVITSGPSNGTLVNNNDGTFTYTHDGSETAGDAFSYTIDDASGATSNVASVTLTVTPQNDAPTAVNDTATVAEGASVLIDLAGNDSDPDNALDLTSLVITSGPSNGTLVDNNDGTFTYTHDGSETIGDAFSYTIDDASGATSNVASVTLTVTPQNDAPTAVNDTATVNEGASVLIDLAGNDSDPDNALDLTSLVITSGPSNGTLVDNNDGTFTYTHDGSDTTGDAFSYTIDDASGATSNVASVTLTVTPQNDAPTAVDDMATVNEGASVLIDLAGNDSDPDNALDPTSLVITSGPSNGTLVNNNDGTFTYTHDGSETAGDAFSYTIDDASGATSNVASVTLTVTPQNDAPTAVNDTATVNEGASVLIDLAGNDSDPDNALDLTSLVITSGPSSGTLVDNNDGTFTYTHDGSETAGDAFSYTIDDASGATSNVASVTLTVTPQNDAPTAVNDTATVAEGASVLIDLAGNDSDPDNALDLTSLVITSGPSSGTLVDNNDGTFTYTHDGSETTGDAFSYTIDDASGATSNVASVTLTVTSQNDAPTAVNDTATVAEGASILIDLSVNDSDPDNSLDLTSLVITSGPSNGTLVDNNDGTFTYTHDGSETAGDAFSYTIDDASGATSNVASVTLTVTPQNDAPTAVNDTATVNEGASVLIDLAGNDSDPDNALDLTSLVITSGPSSGTLVDNNDGTFTYTHDGSETAGDAFSYTIDDASGATSNVASVTLTVTPQNDAPTAVNDTATVAEGASVLIDLAGNDSDPDNALDLTSLVITSGPSSGTLVDNNDGTFTYTHDGSETTGDAFSYTIDDASGATSNVASVTLTVTPQNDAPTAVDDTATVNEGASVLIHLAGNDSDPDNALDLTSLVITSGPSNGTLVNNNDGTFTYTHDGSETAGDAFSYTIDDASGATSNVASVTLTVTPQNDAPQVDLDADDSTTVGTGFDTTFVTTTGPVSIVDGDASIGDPDSMLVGLSVTITNMMDPGSEFLGADTTGTSIVASYDAGAGVLTLSGADSAANYEQVLRTITYDNTVIPPDGTTRTIAFVADDGLDLSNVAESHVGIVITNVAPTAAPDSVTVGEGGSSVIDLAANDTDYEGALDLTSIQIVAAPSNGSLVVASDGTVTYTHDGSETVGDSFSYTIRDADGATSNVATVSIAIDPVNDTPTATGEAYSTSEDTSLVVASAAGVVADEFDAEGDSLSATLVSGPANAASFTLNTDGSFSYVPTANFAGTDSFSYTVGDGSATSGAAAVLLTVLPENDAPEMVCNEGTLATPGLADSITSSELAVSDVDDAVSDLVFSLPQQPTAGHLELTTNPGVAVTSFSQADIDAGRLFYQVDDATAASDSFSFTVSDPGGETLGQASFDITVQAAPVAPAPISPTPVGLDPTDMAEDSDTPEELPEEQPEALPPTLEVEEEVPDVETTAPSTAPTSFVIETKVEVEFNEGTVRVHAGATSGEPNAEADGATAGDPVGLHNNGGDGPNLVSATMSPLDLENLVERALDQATSGVDRDFSPASAEIQIWVARSERVVMAAGLSLVAALLRTGSLLALTASSVPIWKGLDPVAALLVSDDRRQRLADEARFAERIEDETDDVGRVLDDNGRAGRGSRA